MYRLVAVVGLALFINSLISGSSGATTASPRSDVDDEEIDQSDAFQYSFAVEDDPQNSSRLEHSRQESSDGREVTGQYKVLLPDGRIQTVTYTSGPDGYKADIQYTQTNSLFQPRIASITAKVLDDFTSTRLAATVPPIASAPVAVRPSSRSRSVTTTAASVEEEDKPIAVTVAATTAKPIEQESTRSRSRQRLRTWAERISELEEGALATSTSGIVSTVASTPAAVITDAVKSVKAKTARTVIGAPKMKTTWDFEKFKKINAEFA